MALRGLTTEVKTMTRIARSPTGPNPRRRAATGSPGGGAARASRGERRDVLWQIRGVAGHALFRNTQGLTRRSSASASCRQKVTAVLLLRSNAPIEMVVSYYRHENRNFTFSSI